jgi:hypothetical protein
MKLLIKGDRVNDSTNGVDEFSDSQVQDGFTVDLEKVFSAERRKEDRIVH